MAEKNFEDIETEFDKKKVIKLDTQTYDLLEFEAHCQAYPHSLFEYNGTTKLIKKMPPTTAPCGTVNTRISFDLLVSSNLPYFEALL
jgi:hypothetical protein